TRAVNGNQRSDDRRRYRVSKCRGGGWNLLAVEMLHAAQVAFTFLTDVGNKQQRRGGNNGNLLESSGQGPEGGQSGAVVADAGAKQAKLFAVNVEHRGGRENRVQMRADGDRRSLRLEARAGGEQVSNSVGRYGKAELAKALTQPAGAGMLGKGRCGNRGDGKLEVGNLALVPGEPLKKSMNARVGGKAVNLFSQRGWLRALRLPSVP